MKQYCITLLCVVAVFVLTCGANATIYNLADDWSDTSNPNGVWSYNMGDVPLPNNETWGSPTQQNWWSWQGAYDAQYNPAPPAWALSAGADGFVMGHSATPPGKLSNLGVNQSVYPYNLAYRLSNVTWTSSGAGSITIDGQAWEDSAGPGRNDNWRLYVNGVEYAERLYVVGVNRDTPAALFSNNLLAGYSLSNIPVQLGDLVKFELEAAYPYEYGSVVSLDLNIDFAPVPEPATMILLGQGGLLLGRKRRA